MLISWDFHAQKEFAENGVEKQETFSEKQLCGQKCIVNEQGQRIRASLVEADRKVTEMQLVTHYNKRASEHTMHQTS